MREVCVCTSSRADFGLLHRVMELIRDDNSLRLRVVATGSHLAPEFGLTVKEVQHAGFTIDEELEILLSADTPSAICKTMGLAMIGFGEILTRLSPDILVLLGDRYETLCAAAAAQVCRVPVAHIHGGETSQGAIDEAFRHAITKMSHLHFTSCEEHRNRVTQLGEEPHRVFNVGALGVENARRAVLLNRPELEERIGLPADRPLLLATFHPVTLERSTAAEQFAALLAALDNLDSHFVVFTKANADTEGRVINRLLKEYASGHSDRMFVADSLGMRTYLSMMSLADAVVGNSSSGILEAPAFRVPTVNIGDRQKGRVRADSVIDCAPDTDSIIAALRRALSAEFRTSLAALVHPCDRPDTAASIVRHLRKAVLDTILKKSFHDIASILPDSRGVKR